MRVRLSLALFIFASCSGFPTFSYSEEARVAKLQGSVILRVVVSATGQVENAVVLRGPGHRLDPKALEAVQGWRFTPAVGPDGKPVACMVNIEMTFRIG